MPDRSSEVAQFIQDSYPTFEFVPIRLSDAFDKQWWKQICGEPSTKWNLTAQLGPGKGSAISFVLALMASF